MGKLLMVLMSLMLTLPLYGAVELRSLSKSNGLSDGQVNTIFKDSTGYVWIGTQLALDRFDGNHVRSFQFPGEDSGTGFVLAITELRRDEVYAGTRKGLYVVDRSENGLRQIMPDKLNMAVNALADDGRRYLYAGTDNGVYIYDAVKNTLMQQLLGHDVLSQDNAVREIFNSSALGLWAASAHVLYNIDPAKGRTLSFKLPVNGMVTRMTEYQGILYIGTRGNGVIPFDMVRHRFLEPLHFGNDIITAVSPDGRGSLLVATDGEGFYNYDIRKKSIVSHVTSDPESSMVLRSNSIYSLYVDVPRQSIVIGYYQHGLEYMPYHDQLFRVYSYPGLIDTRNYAVRALAMDGDVKVIGTREGLYYIDEATGRTAKFTRPQIRSNLIFCVYKYKGLYYIGTYEGGLYTLDSATLRIAPYDAGGAISAQASVFDMKSDRKGNLWIGTSDGLVRVSGNQVVAHYTSLNSQLPQGNVYDVFFDSRGRGWFCTENGIAVWNGSQLRADKFPEGFINDRKVRDIFEDSEHTLYFAPERGRLFRSDLDLSKFGYINYGADDANSMVTFITEDSDGWLWLGTDKGVVRFDKRSRSRTFNNADGMVNVVSTLCPAITDKRGDIWMGNSQGLLRMDRKHLNEIQSGFSAPQVISDIQTQGRSIINRLEQTSKGRYRLVLNSNESELKVFTANLRYVLPEYYFVEYKLDGGVDEEWHQVSGNTPIEIHELSIGERTLHIRKPGDPDTDVEIVIRKHPGKLTLVLYGVAALLLVTGIWALVTMARHRREHREMEQERQELREQLSAGTVEEEKAARASYRTSRLTDEECKRLLKLLDEIMKHDKPYTNPSLKSNDLARMANTTGHSLSYLFNQYLERSYYDYVNAYRVDEFKRLVRDTDTSRYTLAALAEKCGFSSRATFFRHFKAIAGITPAEYLKQQGKGSK